MDELVIGTAIEGLDLVPSAPELSGAEVELVDVPARERRLAASLADLTGHYDRVLIDCPPSLGLLTLNALTAADGVLIPIQTEYYALEGLSQLVNTIRLVREGLNPRLEIDGVLLTMYDARTNLSAQVAAEVRRHMNGSVYDTVVPRSVRLSEAPSHGLPVALYDPASRGRSRTARWPARSPPVASERSSRGSASAAASTPLSRGPPAMSPACSSSPVGRIRRNPHQPRERFDDERLGELAASIAVHGVLQPILVRALPDGEYELVAGERRLRATRLAGLERIPAIVRETQGAGDQLEIALIENVQRADLNAIETASPTAS